MKIQEQIISNGAKIKYLISLIAIIITAFGIFLVPNKIFGQGETGDSAIKYPIAELGNCADKASCGAYCDKPKNEESCLNFAEQNNLMSKEEVKVAKNFIASGDKGPGGCTSKESCESYCDDVSRIDECVSFAEKNNLMPPEELAEAKKIQAAVARGVKPPPCKNKEQCDAYCEDSDHMEECINFATEAGFIQGKELEDAQKMLIAIKKGVKPLPCKGKEACDAYCGNPDNMEVCMNFAMEAGFMNEQEKADAQKMLQAVKKGVKPPNCKSKEECDVYCGEEQHFEECVNFAEAAGMMSSEDAAMSRKTKGKGPGGCKGKEECEAFCKNNQEECFNFAKENGLISEEDLKGMEEGRQGMQNALMQAPQEVLSCLEAELGVDTIEKLKNGTAMPSQEIGDKMGECFEKIGPPEGTPGQGGFAPGQTGPGGCKTPEECDAYCKVHPEECQRFQPGPGAINPGEQMMSPQSGPGGCSSPEKCQSYCTSNPDACRNFSPDSQSQTPPSLPSPFPMPPEGNTEGQIPPPPTGMMPPPGSYPTSPEGVYPAVPSGTYPTPPSGPYPMSPQEGNIPLSPFPLNSSEPPLQPPVNMQPPLDQQLPMQPSPGNFPPPPSSFNVFDLLSAIGKTFSSFLNNLNGR